MTAQLLRRTEDATAPAAPQETNQNLFWTVRVELMSLCSHIYSINGSTDEHADPIWMDKSLKRQHGAGNLPLGRLSGSSDQFFALADQMIIGNLCSMKFVIKTLSVDAMLSIF